jgi:hypothetical protein
MRWAGHVVLTGEERKVYNVLVGKSEGKTPLGRQRHRWEVGGSEWMSWGVWIGFDWLRTGTGGRLLLVR